MIDPEVLAQAAAKQKALLEMTEKSVGKKRVAVGSDPSLLLDTISMDEAVGVPGLDQILGGGWRLGRMGMVVGAESTGKTLVTQWTIKAFQMLGLSCGFMDPEKTYDEAWFRVTGVDTDRLLVVRGLTLEAYFELACEWAAAGVDLIVMDSLAAMVPGQRMEHALDKQEYMGLAPRKISEGLAKLTATNLNTFILCTNQMRSKIGVVYGSPDEIPGGRAQKFYASWILKTTRGGWITEGPEKDSPRIGYKLKIRAEKSKLSPPFQTAEIPFLYTGMVDATAGMVELALDLELIPKNGSFYKWGDETIHGLAKLKTFFGENPDQMEVLKNLISKDDGIPEFE